jgi:hypothetical protein
MEIGEPTPSDIERGKKITKTQKGQTFSDGTSPSVLFLLR